MKISLIVFGVLLSSYFWYTLGLFVYCGQTDKLKKVQKWVWIIPFLMIAVPVRLLINKEFKAICCYLMMRSKGILYVSILERFLVERKKAVKPARNRNIKRLSEFFSEFFPDISMSGQRFSWM